MAEEASVASWLGRVGLRFDYVAYDCDDDEFEYCSLQQSPWNSVDGYRRFASQLYDLVTEPAAVNALAHFSLSAAGLRAEREIGCQTVSAS